MIDVQIGTEITPGIEMPPVYNVANIDTELCQRFSDVALPLMEATDGVEMYHVCDKDEELSRLTQLILGETVEQTQEFIGPVFATLTGYNLSSESFGTGNSNGYHYDGGGTEVVSIVSTSGEAFLHLAWVPVWDPEENFLQFEKIGEGSESVIDISNAGETIGYVRPVQVADCKPGTVIRINQKAGNGVITPDGYTW